ncbi:hypothetical protein MMC09_000550 [Bachmanniomyces sp. S44760]|nr:hypothetical protein [Bachmanniomyces sp. S44760]
MEKCIKIIAPVSLVKHIKTNLEKQANLDKEQKISKFTRQDIENYFFDRTLEEEEEEGEEQEDADQLRLIPTSISCERLSVSALQESRLSLLARLDLEVYDGSIVYAIIKPSDSSTRHQIDRNPPKQGGKLARTVSSWLQHLPADLISALPPAASHPLISNSTWTYTIYGLLLLLPRQTFASPLWSSPHLTPHLPILYSQICTNLHVTHIALNAPIPLQALSTSGPYPNVHNQNQTENKNILRSPTHLTPLHGSFGPHLPQDTTPTSTDFAAAFWTETSQHHILQTWAPLHTMFSRGNISEKRRILDMSELTPAVLGTEVGETSAVDLYAGIGYFAFCYAKRGVGRVFCWEINGWSVEGLRKGAGRNGWGVRVIKRSQPRCSDVEGQVEEEEEGEEDGRQEEKDESEEQQRKRGLKRLTVFQEDNKFAAERIEKMRTIIPPVRHVNCGYLPSSSDSWCTAIKILDPEAGGWIHAHENIGVDDIVPRTEQVLSIFQSLLDDLDDLRDHKGDGKHHVHGAGKDGKRRVSCSQGGANRVKSYAPGVMHCVWDIYIPPQILVS